jgi:hypothetical protein
MSENDPVNSKFIVDSVKLESDYDARGFLQNYTKIMYRKFGLEYKGNFNLSEFSAAYNKKLQSFVNNLEDLSRKEPVKWETLHGYMRDLPFDRFLEKGLDYFVTNGINDNQEDSIFDDLAILSETKSFVEENQYDLFGRN